MMKTPTMRKMLLMLLLLAAAVPSAMAQNLTTYVNNSYEGTLTVTIDGESYVHTGITMYVRKMEQGTLRLSIREFRLNRDGEVIPIGNIVIPDVQLQQGVSSSLVGFTFSRTLTIADGNDSDDLNTAGGEDIKPGGGGGWGSDDDEGTIPDSGVNAGTESNEEEWTGPSYGELSVNSRGSMSTSYAEVTCEVTIPSLGKKAYATFYSRNVSTGISMAKTTPQKGNKRYTVSGIPASASYRGIVINQ